MSNVDETYQLSKNIVEAIFNLEISSPRPSSEKAVTIHPIISNYVYNRDNRMMNTIAQQNVYKLASGLSMQEFDKVIKLLGISITMPKTEPAEVDTKSS